MRGGANSGVRGEIRGNSLPTSETRIEKQNRRTLGIFPVVFHYSAWSRQKGALHVKLNLVPF